MALTDESVERYKQRYEEAFDTQCAADVYRFIDENEREWTPYGAVVEAFEDEYDEQEIAEALFQICRTRTLKRTYAASVTREYQSSAAYKSAEVLSELEQFEPIDSA